MIVRKLIKKFMQANSKFRDDILALFRRLSAIFRTVEESKLTSNNKLITIIPFEWKNIESVCFRQYEKLD